jgi:hypothetical protein
MAQTREPFTPKEAQAELDAMPELQGPPEEIGTGLYRMVDGEVVGDEPEPQQL